jgi:glycolate oxidase FAD binding subunit
MESRDLTAAIAERLREASAQRAPLRLAGGDTKRFYGRAVHGGTLDLTGHSGVVNYDPAELVLTARCGTRLADIERLLADHGQRLAFDPPRHGPGATIGGAIAAGLAGPSRMRHGALRDHVQGVRLMTGDGRALKFGGEVLKNVAGYDVSRLMAGSLGILGVLLELSLRVLPRPAAELSLTFESDAADGQERLAGWSAKSLPMTASTWVDGRLCVRFEGTEATLVAVHRQVGGEPLVDAAAFWSSVRDQTHPFFAAAARLWRVQLPADGRLPLDEDAALYEWMGAQRWYRDPDRTDFRALATAAGGSATIFRGAAADEEVFAPLEPAVLALHKSLKMIFDPAGIVNPGRMYASL